MISGKAEGIEILGYGDNGRQIIVAGVGGRGKAGLDELASQGNWVRRLEVKAAREE